MKKLFILFVGLFLIGASSVQAQSALKVDEIIVVNTQVNNVMIQLKTGNQSQAVASRITQSQVSQKAGFNPTLDTGSGLLTLHFTRQFTENELNSLLEYSGIKLGKKAFNELYHLINQ